MSFAVEKSEYIRTPRIWIGSLDSAGEIDTPVEDIATVVIDKITDNRYIQYQSEVNPDQSGCSEQPFTRVIPGIHIFTGFVHPKSPLYPQTPRLLCLSIESSESL